MTTRKGAGCFIVLEGIDGVGKSTQVALLAAWLDAAEVPHVVVREPGGTPLGEVIRDLVLKRTDLDVGPASELLMMLAARAALVRDVVGPALEAGKLVLADRFALSTLAYQAYGRGLDPARVHPALDIATGGLRPDLYVVLDLPLREAAERRHRGRGRPDRFESEGEAFRHKVRDAYLALAQDEPGVELLDAQGTPEEVHARICGLLAARLPAFVPAASGGPGRRERDDG
ncbi:MAG: dTMP kinase [Gemmatimonadetes bacterium]|nr:dTMP kinase [Gemmatimonadota bacterium]